MTRLDRRSLGRTLLLRQHLLERSSAGSLAMVEHLIGLQAQDQLPPYLALAARVERFDPHDLSAALAERRAVRLLSMRGTVHVLSAADALTLRRWVQPMLDRQAARNPQSRPARHLVESGLVAEIAELVAAQLLPVQQIGELLARRHPGVAAQALAHVARESVPLVQTPPRGLWAQSGGVVYAHLEHWLQAPQRDLDVRSLVRRYLRSYGPATAADITAWSGVTRLGPVVAAMRDELEVRTGPEGRALYDVPGAPLADADVPAPVRLLGKYDNLWLSHAARDRVVSAEDRPRWMGPNGGAGNALFVDGAMAGLWRADGKDRAQLRVDPWRRLTRAERAELDEELDRMRQLLAVPARRAS